jgi:hypothetical protein
VVVEILLFKDKDKQMQTIFFKNENNIFSAKLGNEFVEIQEDQLGEFVGKIITLLMQEAYSKDDIHLIEKNAEHIEFSNYWNLVKEKHTLVHDDLIKFEKLIKG